MPVVAFEGEITVVDDLGQVEGAVEELRRHAVLGIDTETKPSFRPLFPVPAEQNRFPRPA